VTLPASPLTTRQARDQRVFAVVRELLASHGMQLSMETVAQHVGCSKQTLYSRFGSKQELMRQVLDQHVGTTFALLDAPQGEPLHQTLVEFAISFLAHRAQPRVIQACLQIAADSRQFPDQARQLYRDGAEQLQARVAEWLAAAVGRGELRHDDPHFMAEMLLSMIGGLDFERQRFHTPHRADAAERQRWAEFSVASFLRAFAPDKEPGTPLHSYQYRSFS